ncbi:MAG: hypothetical protein HY222_03795 [Thaumarchaeota archaeon]|nr:hypothetical protein [Nitrososphaerota archaeon]MBI3641497.1 hypothetical protein [Nitrososphaerota archaeon]
MLSKHKPSLGEMWKFIDGIMSPNKLVPNKSILTYEQVFSIYSKLYEIDEIFREVAQINILKKELTEQENNPIKL